MKKRMLSVLVLALLLFSLTACGQDTVSSELVGIPNPMVEYTTLKEAEKVLGYGIHLPEGHVIKTVYVIDGDLLDLRLADGSSLRKARKSEDISGDYTVFDSIKEVKTGDKIVAVKTDSSHILLMWQQDGFSYAYSSKTLTEEAMLSAAAEIK